MTLWLTVTLAMVAVALGRYLSTETRLMRYHLAHAQAKAWARAGVYLAMQRLAQDTDEDYDWAGDGWAKEALVQLPSEGRVTIRMTDEERKLNVNRIGEPTLNPVFVRLLGGPEPVALLADYLDPDATPRPLGLEERAEASSAYLAKNGPIAVLEEIREIPGMTEALVTQLAQSASPLLAAESTLNINTATPAVLNACFEAAGFPGLAQHVVEFRWDPDDPQDAASGNRFTQLLGEIRTAGGDVLGDELKARLSEVMVGSFGAVLGVRSDRFRLDVVGETVQPPARYRIEAVVRRGASGETRLSVGRQSFQILAWLEG